LNHPLAFDSHQFQTGAMLVKATYTRSGDWESNGLGWNDVPNMHCSTHKLFPSRRSGAPEWAYQPAKLRELLVRYVEDRAHNGNFRNVGTLLERLKKAQEKLALRRPEMIERIDGLCKKYVAMKKCDGETQAVKDLAAVIRNLDTLICFESRVAEVVLGVVFFYWNCGADSVQVGQRLGIQPPHVRQILYKLGKTWKKMQNPGPRPAPERVPLEAKIQCKLGRPLRPKIGPANVKLFSEQEIARIIKWRKEGRNYNRIALALGRQRESIRTKVKQLEASQMKNRAIWPG
jgi:hypothetical protein